MAQLKLFTSVRSQNAILHPKWLIVAPLTLLCFMDSNVFSITGLKQNTPTVKFHWRTALIVCLFLPWCFFGTPWSSCNFFSTYKYWEFQDSDWVVWIGIPVFFFNVTSRLKSWRAFESCRLGFISQKQVFNVCHKVLSAVCLGWYLSWPK